jgi:hypothetical protein
MKQRTTVTADELTLSEVCALPSLEAVDPMPRAIEHAVKRRAAAEAATAAYQAAQEQARSGDNPRARASAARSPAGLRAAMLDATDAVDQAVGELDVARRQAFDRVAPVIRQRHVDTLNRIEPVIRQLAAIITELIEIESVAGRFMLMSNASIAPSRSPIGGAEVGGEMKLRTQAWLDTIARLQPSA